MRTNYLMTLRPLEMYFFGNEKTFLFDSDDTGMNRYFIKSERFPAQTTLLGMLRYALMPVKHADFHYSDEELQKNGSIVGTESYDLEKEEQSFGCILSISPVFLSYGKKKYVKTPLDHNLENTLHYSPFRDYRAIETDGGSKWYTPEFRAKEGLTDSFMDVESGELISSENVFDNQLRVGINKQRKNKSFFKKSYSLLKEGWSFAAYVELDADKLMANDETKAELLRLQCGTVVFLGQSKSAFLLRIEQEENLLDSQISKHLHPNAVYCLGDMIADTSVYNCCRFAAVNQRDHRAITTSFVNNNGRRNGQIIKTEKLHKLICSGSVFLVDDPDNWKKQQEFSHYQRIGFNTYITGREV